MKTKLPTQPPVRPPSGPPLGRLRISALVAILLSLISLIAQGQDGNSLGTAYRLGILDKAITRSGNVNDASPVDFYEFEVSQFVREVTATIPGDSHSGWIQMTIAVDRNGDGLLEEFSSSSAYGGNALSSTLWLDPGVYYVRVLGGSGYSTPYLLSLTQIPKPGSFGNADNTAPASRLHPLPDFTHPINDFVGVPDPVDFYPFVISNQVNEVTATIPGGSHSGWIQMSIVRDLKGDGVLEELSVASAYGGNDIVNYLWLDPGTYYVRVLTGGGYNTTYDLSLSRVPKPGSRGLRDNTPADARNFPFPDFSGLITDFVGSPDLVDFYPFVISNHVTEVISTIPGASHTGWIQMSIVRVRTADGVVEDLSVASAYGGNDIVNYLWLDPGTYYVRVLTGGGYNTIYRLGLSRNTKPLSQGTKDNTPAHAVELGHIITPVNLLDFVGAPDAEDDYHFLVAGPSRNVSAKIPGSSHSAYLRLSLLQDTNGDGIPDELVASSAYGGNDVVVEKVLGPGSYFYRVASSDNTIYKLNLSRTFAGDIGPFIIQQPIDTTISSGHPAIFSVLADGSGALKYEWSLDGTTLPAANGSTLTLQDLVSTPGSYKIRVTVSNDYGSVLSREAVLKVNRANLELLIESAVIVSWPVTNPDSYVLQGASSLAGPWIEVARPVVKVGENRLEVSVRTSERAQFYRLVAAP